MVSDKVIEWQMKNPGQKNLQEFADTEELTEEEKAEVLADWLLEKPGGIFRNAKYRNFYPRRLKKLISLSQIIQKKSDLQIYRAAAQYLEVICRLRMKEGSKSARESEIRAEVYRELASEMVSDGDTEMAKRYMDRAEELYQEDLEKEKVNN